MSHFLDGFTGELTKEAKPLSKTAKVDLWDKLLLGLGGAGIGTALYKRHKDASKLIGEQREKLRAAQKAQADETKRSKARGRQFFDAARKKGWMVKKYKADGSEIK